MRISDWSSAVCSSDLTIREPQRVIPQPIASPPHRASPRLPGLSKIDPRAPARRRLPSRRDRARLALCPTPRPHATLASERRKPMQAVTEGDRRKELATLLTQIKTHPERTEKHTSELKST